MHLIIEILLQIAFALAGFLLFVATPFYILAYVSGRPLSVIETEAFWGNILGCLSPWLLLTLTMSIMYRKIAKRRLFAWKEAVATVFFLSPVGGLLALYIGIVASLFMIDGSSTFSAAFQWAAVRSALGLPVLFAIAILLRFIPR